MEAVIFVGIQASGKSTLYKEKFFKTHLRINLDMLKTRPKEQIIFKACLKAKQAVVIDNTNPTTEDRQRYIPFAKEAGFKVIGYFFETDIEAALNRNKNRTGKELIPEPGIRATYGKLQPPKLTEGFDLLYRVMVNEYNQFIVEEREF